MADSTRASNQWAGRLARTTLEHGLASRNPRKRIVDIGGSHSRHAEKGAERSYDFIGRARFGRLLAGTILAKAVVTPDGSAVLDGDWLAFDLAGEAAA